LLDNGEGVVGGDEDPGLPANDFCDAAQSFQSGNFRILDSKDFEALITRYSFGG
jgi:hypothetical protein